MVEYDANIISPHKGGIIKLESYFVSRTINKFVQLTVKGKNKSKLKDFFKKNPSNEELIFCLEEFSGVILFKSILFWFSKIHCDFTETTQILKKSNMNLNQLLNNWISFLYDASFCEYFWGHDGRERVEVVVGVQEVLIKKFVLNAISIYPWKSIGLEYTGLLLGRRNRDLSIKEITDFIPIKSGVRDEVPTSFQEIAKCLFKERNKEETVVGWYHSHPFDYPVYYYMDKVAHNIYCFMFSIYRTLKLAGVKGSDYGLLYISNILTVFEYDQVLFLLRAIKGGFSNSSCRSDLIGVIAQYIAECRKAAYNNIYYENNEFSKAVSKGYKRLFIFITKYFKFLKKAVEFILHKYKKCLDGEILSFEVLPTVGFVICPESRYVAAIEYSLNIQHPRNFSNGWVYCRINPF